MSRRRRHRLEMRAAAAAQAAAVQAAAVQAAAAQAAIAQASVYTPPPSPDVATLQAPAVVSVGAQTANQTWTRGAAVSLSIAANTFTDSQHQALTYTASQADGSVLPNWLQFNAATETFSGTVPTASGNLSLKVTATDRSGISASETFAVGVVTAPVVTVAAQTATQTWTQGSAVSFALASNTFADSQNQALVYTATQANGSALPTWLHFNAATKTFTGTVAAGTSGLSVKLIATDASGVSASETFAVSTPVLAMRASNFLGTLGVNTHIAYTDGLYASVSRIEADLSYLGINQVRDGISNGEGGSAGIWEYEAIAQTGVQFTIFSKANGTAASVQSQVALIATLNQAVPGSVIAVEGSNEVNNWGVTYNGVGGLQGAVNLQAALYSAVHSNAGLAGVAVDYFTGYGAGSIGVGPNPLTTPGLADFDTQHPYAQGGQAPAGWINPTSVLSNEGGTPGPAVYTETGYSTVGSGWDVVNQDVQAKYTLDLVLDAARDGVSKTYLYQLMDAYAPGSPQGDDGYGMFDYTQAPKAAATAIHNLTSILADNGTSAASFTAGTLAYTLQGMPSTANSLLLEKSNGAYDLTIWNEPQIWNPSTKQEISVAPTTISILLANTAGQIKIFDPLVGATAIQTLQNTNTIQLSITDHPLIVEIEPATAAPPPVVSLATQTGSQTWAQGAAVAFTLASNTFAESQGGALSYTATQADGSALPTWLTFNVATRTFTGTVPNTVSGLSLKVTATDSYGSAASETFAVNTPSAPPVVSAVTANQVWMTNQADTFRLATNTFSDPQGQALAFAAYQVGDTSATPWLHFNAATGTFSGTPPVSTTGTLQLEVIATNQSGQKVGETFSVTMASTATQFTQAVASLHSSVGSAQASASIPPVNNLHVLSAPVA